MRPYYYKKPKPETIKKWIGVNRNKFSVEIFELERIINSGTADDFTKSMYEAVTGGRKITPKMEDAIDNIIKRNSPEEQFKRDEWVQKVVPKIMMVKEMISQTDWTENYRAGSYQFVNSIIKQAKSRKSLSKKQMEAVSNLYLRVKKNIDKQHGGK